jgi:hypothetical protein
MRAPHGTRRIDRAADFRSGFCEALFHIELPDFWNDQWDVVISVFEKGSGVGSRSRWPKVWEAEFVGAVQKNWEQQTVLDTV